MMTDIIKLLVRITFESKYVCIRPVVVINNDASLRFHKERKIHPLLKSLAIFFMHDICLLGLRVQIN